ncbi:MAG: GNAT family N-acetyltransferase [Candidatus Eisenbacteria bacterium]|nr:GNAT family N-acetyltransferase [Candidatus Eisenbacteria bacterium]
MPPSDDTSAIQVRRLQPRDAPEALSFLDSDPVANVYLVALVLRDAFARPGHTCWAASRRGRLTALLYLGGSSGAVLPIGDDREALRLLGEIASPLGTPPRFQVIGAQPSVAGLLETYPGGGLEPRLRRRQIYMALAPGALPVIPRLPELRPAQREDYALVYESGAQLRAEELLEDPREEDPVAYARRTEEECRDGHTYVWRDDRGLVFRASISALTSEAAQVSGVWTAPPWRNQGVARRALAELCVRLQERTRDVCLFVNDTNAPAISLYHRLGFADRLAWASVFFVHPS